MENIGGWLLGIGFSAIVGGLVYMLSPKGATDRTVKIFVSLFILSVAVAPIAKGDVSFTYPDAVLADDKAIDENGLSDMIADLMLENARSAVKLRVREVLEEYGAEEENITVDVWAHEGKIIIRQIIIEAEDGYENFESNIEKRIIERTGAGEVSFK